MKQDAGKKLETTLKTEVEPSVIGVGPYHVIVGKIYILIWHNGYGGFDSLSTMLLLVS